VARAERQPHTHLLRALGHGVGEHAVDADEREQRRHRRRRPQHHSMKAATGQRVAHQLLERSDRVQAGGAVGGRNRRANARHQCPGITRGPRREGHEAERDLIGGALR
jgi:hypothetical protein